MIKINIAGIIEDVWCDETDLKDICSEIWYRDSNGNVVPRMWTTKACDNLIISIQMIESEFECMREEYGVIDFDWSFAYRLRFLSLFSNLVYDIENARLREESSFDYLKNVEKASRLAHIFTIKNLRKSYYAYDENPENTELDISDDVIKSEAFMLQYRLWKVYVNDGSWCLAFDGGNGYYIRASKYNSYKLITKDF